MPRVTEYKSITLAESKANPEYWRLMEYMYKEQAARIIQKKFRNHTNHWFRGTYSETLKGPLSLKFINEPLNNDYKQHAQKIKNGEWLALNFDDPEFVRNIYKALRLKQINADQLATAVLLHDGREHFKDEKYPVIKQYGFDDKAGPYQPRKIPYATDQDFKDFTQKLQNIPEGERAYFSINFSKKHDAEFLFIALSVTGPGNLLKFLQLDNYHEYCSLFIQKSTLSSDAKISLEKDLTLLCSDKSSDVEIMKKCGTANDQALWDAFGRLQQFLLNEMHETVYSQDIVDNGKFSGSMKLLVALLTSSETQTNLYLTVSPDHNPKEANSPLLCLNLPTVSAYKAFQHAIHGEDHAVDPFFTAGQFAPRLVREADEHPEKFDSKQALRPVELGHPDLVSQPKPHGAPCTSFMNSWHDYGLHTSRSSAHTCKPFIRYLRAMLEAEKGFDMSKALYALIDLDGNMGVQDRTEYKGKLSPYSLEKILTKATDPDKNFFILPFTDNSLLMIADMITHREKWKTYLSAYPEDFFNEAAFGNLKAEHTAFHTTFSEMKKIINSTPSRDASKSKLFYLISYHLRDKPDALKLCRELETKIGLENILVWNRNEGYKFRPECSVMLGDVKQETYQTTPDKIPMILSRLNTSIESKELSPAKLIKKKFEDYILQEISQGRLSLLTERYDLVKGMKRAKIFDAPESKKQLRAAFMQCFQWNNCSLVENMLGNFKKLAFFDILKDPEFYQSFMVFLSNKNNRELELFLGSYLKIAVKFKKLHADFVFPAHLTEIINKQLFFELLTSGCLDDHRYQNAVHLVPSIKTTVINLRAQLAVIDKEWYAIVNANSWKNFSSPYKKLIYDFYEKVSHEIIAKINKQEWFDVLRLLTRIPSHRFLNNECISLLTSNRDRFPDCQRVKMHDVDAVTSLNAHPLNKYKRKIEEDGPQKLAPLRTIKFFDHLETQVDADEIPKKTSNFNKIL